MSPVEESFRISEQRYGIGVKSGAVLLFQMICVSSIGVNEKTRSILYAAVRSFVLYIADPSIRRAFLVSLTLHVGIALQ